MPNGRLTATAVDGDQEAEADRRPLLGAQPVKRHGGDDGEMAMVSDPSGGYPL